MNGYVDFSNSDPQQNLLLSISIFLKFRKYAEYTIYSCFDHSILFPVCQYKYKIFIFIPNIRIFFVVFYIFREVSKSYCMQKTNFKVFFQTVLFFLCFWLCCGIIRQMAWPPGVFFTAVSPAPRLRYIAAIHFRSFMIKIAWITFTQNEKTLSCRFICHHSVLNKNRTRLL